MHPLTRANYLASPPLVVAYALAGTVSPCCFLTLVVTNNRGGGNGSWPQCPLHNPTWPLYIFSSKNCKDKSLALFVMGPYII